MYMVRYRILILLMLTISQIKPEYKFAKTRIDLFMIHIFGSKIDPI